MVIISKTIINDFLSKHGDAEVALVSWYESVADSNWKSFNEMKSSFNSVDAVGNDRYVFNVKGNHYRLIALIIFKVRTVFILFIGTHKDYDKVNAAEVRYRKL